MELTCAVQNYDWGKLGSTSEVAQLAVINGAVGNVTPDKPFAELWMGTHPSGPSRIKNSKQLLSEWIAANPESLGKAATTKFGKELPFLFKVLSIRKALSIQAHPDKKHAEKLHKLRPDLYRDPNHKPEMALALTPFEALCGFRPLAEILNFFERVPELRNIVKNENAVALASADEANVKEALKACFNSLMTYPEVKMKADLRALVARVEAMEESARPDVLGDLLLRLMSEFPDDVGCFGIYFFNYVLLKPGEAMFLGPNEPHAYLSGDCVECMACSDNVVRAGLTPKLKDVPTLCEMLTYIQGTSEEKKFKGIKEDDFTVVFRPPVPDFAVAKIDIPAGREPYQIIPRSAASIILVVQGSGDIKRGMVLFLKAEQKMTVNKSNNSVLMFQAFCPL